MDFLDFLVFLLFLCGFLFLPPCTGDTTGDKESNARLFRSLPCLVGLNNVFRFLLGVFILKLSNSLSRLSNIIHTISLSRSNSNKKLDNISVRSLSLSDKPCAIYLNAFKNTRSRSRSTGQLQDLAL